MSQTIAIYHNPRCSKSRQALALLQDAGIEPEIVRYLDQPLTAAEVEALIDKLGVAPHALVRAKEAAYEEAGLSDDSTRQQISRAIAAHPILLERPIIVRGDKAVIGRPPERARELL